jgi:hypothetical protein
MTSAGHHVLVIAHVAMLLSTFLPFLCLPNLSLQSPQRASAHLVRSKRQISRFALSHFSLVVNTLYLVLTTPFIQHTHIHAATMSITPPGSPASNHPWNPSLTPQLQPVEYVQCPPFYPADAHESTVLHASRPRIRRARLWHPALGRRRHYAHAPRLPRAKPLPRPAYPIVQARAMVQEG